jgi:catechol 2,3-dioxygenase-like lactoylglutathione lyase family enzyme
MTRKFMRMLFALAIAAATSRAQLPDFYKTISGAVWVVRDAPSALTGWRNIGLENIRDHQRITLDGTKPISARFVTGKLANLDVEILQPDAGDPVFDAFLQHHGQGVFAVLHPVPDQQALDKEIARLGKAGAGVLKTMRVDGARYTFFDTEAKGKYVLGLVLRPSIPSIETVTGPLKLTHLGVVVRDAAPVIAYWQTLGFPPMNLVDAAPREDSRYHGKPLWFSFRVGWSSYPHPTLEWIIPPVDPPNCYADFLRIHGEGVQHLGLLVDDLALAVGRYTVLGFPQLQSGAWGRIGTSNSGQYDYMDTEALGGMSIELIHAIP